MCADPNPPEIVRVAEVLELTGLRRTMLYDLIGKGRFPAQINLGARAVGWYKREVREGICSRSAAKQVSGSTGSNERKTSAVLGTTSEISKTATHETEVQKKLAARNTAAQRLGKEVGDIRVLPTTRSCGSGAAMSETQELQLLRDENARLKQLAGELFLKNSTLLEAVEHRCLRHPQE